MVVVAVIVLAVLTVTIAVGLAVVLLQNLGSCFGCNCWCC